LTGELARLLSDKPETVWPLPEWMLPAESVRALKQEASLAVVEIAGRDSVAAAVSAAGSGLFSAFVPTVAFTGTEFGDWTSPFRAVERLESLVGGRVRVYPPLVVGSPLFWRELCGRPNFRSLADYGFYSPCAGCHLYLHALRIPLALGLGSRAVVAGERLSHEGRIKMSQLGISLDVYRGFFESFGLKLLMPLREVRENRAITDLLGMAWEEGRGQLECVLSGNYLEKDGKVSVDEARLKRFFDEYALPLATEWVEKRLAASADPKA